jgi:hypothetical protein
MIELKSPTKGKKTQSLGFGTPTIELKSQSLGKKNQSLELKTPMIKENCLSVAETSINIV